MSFFEHASDLTIQHDSLVRSVLRVTSKPFASRTSTIRRSVGAGEVSSRRNEKTFHSTCSGSSCEEIGIGKIIEGYNMISFLLLAWQELRQQFFDAFLLLFGKMLLT